MTPAKWVRVWQERLPGVPLTLVPVSAAEGPQVLQDGGADAGLVRLPVDRTSLNAIPLYTETTVVVLPKDHWMTEAAELTVEDLADDLVLHPLDDTLEWQVRPGQPAKERPATTADAIELVAAGVGFLVVPQSLARRHHRRDLTYRPVPDAPQSQVALSWLQDGTTDLVEEFIGIVRGRTVNSSRGRTQAVAEPKQKRAATGGKQQQKAGEKRGGGHARSGSRNAKPGKRERPRRRS